MKNGRMQILSYGTKIWILNGKYHRTDGPALEGISGVNSWFLNDHFYGYGDIPPVDYTLAILILEGMSE